MPDEKFIDAAYRIFEEVNPDNNLFVLVSDGNEFLQYIKNTPITRVTKQEFLSTDFIKTLRLYDMVVLHYLDNLKIQLLARSHNSVNFVWLGWGADYYDLITGDTRKLLKPLTYELFKKQYVRKSIRVIKRIIKKLFLEHVSKSQVINKIRFFAPVLFEDYLLVKKTIPHFRPKYISWNYGTLEDDMIRGFEDYSVSDDNILIGNSATYPNNHLDTFELLKNLQLSGRKIFCPLSYGDSVLKKNIIKIGHKIYGENFFPIKNFLPSEEYINLISSCSVVIMNHLRQQALGNIVIMIYLGAKVFLDEQNPVYCFFKKQGTFVFSMDDLSSEYTTRLDIKSIKHNRNILSKHWSREVILSKTHKLIETIKDDK
ncbi:MAG: TDP-N-acetylfucosamine:lipid II N-acetylfucosaminyltransferase [Desulfobulbaceae bacterium]|nr:TDP-N-acetylfucosamine:lipid II N-acetylfucosaminyltransferase [Desulfobulbaceae bacterium]